MGFPERSLLPFFFTLIEYNKEDFESRGNRVLSVG